MEEVIVVQVPIVFLLEGALTNKPPGFDGKDLYY